MFLSSSAISIHHPPFLPGNLKSIKSKKAHCTGKFKIAATCCFSPTMASPASLYQVLGISMNANSIEIKAAYRKLARTCHPDVVAANQKERSANEFIKINSAYATLSDPYKRAEYDRVVYRHRKSLNYSTPVMSGFAQVGKKWETDQCW
ncbi:hypothetical protein L6164_037609 [Bauhinia variegata]|uniref:Uncharacterized protein n=1 Tax=Bauhinia variegata TaxID=167791 RepID=A0ACB9KKK6_BAUVA|nr:hypothetical protein L6164_037609 [Bauhinia variegata]